MAPSFFSLLAALRLQNPTMRLCPLKKSPEGDSNNNKKKKHTLSSPAIQSITAENIQLTARTYSPVIPRTFTTIYIYKKRIGVIKTPLR